jgi:predicted flap endonuclease-1-like 5' DNA nuclease
MPWEFFLSGLIVGWLLEFALDYFFWRPRRICTEAEQELRESVDLLKREVSRLRQQQGEDKEDGDEEKHADDLTRIWGIGPKVEALLFLQGICTFKELAGTAPDKVEKLLKSGGERFQLSRYNLPETWQKQAALASTGQWPELDTYQAELSRTRRRSAPKRAR